MPSCHGHWLPQLVLRVGVTALLLSSTSAQTTLELSCQDGSAGSDVVQVCTGSGTIAAGLQDTYLLDIASDPGATVFEGFDVDIDARLSSVTGNVDLQTVQPSGAVLTSARNVGEDVVFVNKREVTSGTYQFVVLGRATTTNYILVVWITNERQLNPSEQIVVGQHQFAFGKDDGLFYTGTQILLECCNQDQTSCVGLKQRYPTLADNDNTTNPNFCYIHGNVCTREGRLEELSMPGNSMACTLPAQSLKSLSKLRRIDLSNNHITGNISEIAGVLSSAANLLYFDLSSNAVWGNLSTACGLARTGFVEQIALGGNRLSGAVPACLLALKNLVELRLDGNALVGALPPIQGAKSSKLVYLTAANQTAKGGGLTGSLPGSIGDLSRLTLLDFSGNALTGNLPALPAGVKEVSLASNALTNNGYAEGVPASYGTLNQLKTLKLRNNSLSGFLPAELARIPNLVYLDVSSNVLSSTLPADWTRSSSLALLKLDRNTLTGTIPGTLGSLERLLLLDLSANSFSGTLDEFAERTASSSGTTRFLSVAGNDLSGPLSSVSGLSNLGLFTSRAAAAAASGLPGAGMNLTLDFSGNDFGGAWPTWLFDAIRNAPDRVAVNLTGCVLTCPSGGFRTARAVPPGYLDGLTCQTTSAAGAVQQIPLAQVVQTEAHSSGPSAGAVFGIILAVLIALAAVAYIAWYLRRRTERQRATAAAAFGSGFGGYTGQGRGGAGGGYSTFSDNQAWGDPASGASTPGRGTAANKQKHVGLASVPLSQRGEF